MSINNTLIEENINKEIQIYGWVRTLRSSGSTLGFCNINDGSNVNGMQIIVSEEFMGLNEIEHFFKEVYTGTYLNCYGKLVKSPAQGQEYELLLYTYKIVGYVDPNQYPLVKGRMNCQEKQKSELYSFLLPD